MTETSFGNVIQRLLGERPVSYLRDRTPNKYGYWGDRAVAELHFASELSRANDGRYD